MTLRTTLVMGALLGSTLACESRVPPRQDDAPIQEDSVRAPDSAAVVGDTIMARDTIR